MQPSDNKWDWLGPGSYFWEEDPVRALEYAINTSMGRQKNKTAADTPFVIGAIIDLGNCLNLVELTALDILRAAFYAWRNPLPNQDNPCR
jgi:hypothetical protein